MAGAPALRGQGQGGGGGGQRVPLPPDHPRWVPSHPAALAPHRPRSGTPRPGAEGAPASLGGPEEETRSRRGPRRWGAELQHGLGETPSRPPLCPSARGAHAPTGDAATGWNKKATRTLLVTTAKANAGPDPRPPARAAPRRGGGRLGGRCLQKRKAEAGPLERNVQENHATNPLPFIQGHKHQRARRQPAFRGSTEQISGAGATRRPPRHRDTNTAQPPQGRGRGAGRPPVTTGHGGSTDCPWDAAAAPPRASPRLWCRPGRSHLRGPARRRGCGRRGVRGGRGRGGTGTRGAVPTSGCTCCNGAGSRRRATEPGPCRWPPRGQSRLRR